MNDTPQDKAKVPRSGKRYTLAKMIPFLAFIALMFYGIIPALVQTGFFTSMILIPHKLPGNDVPQLHNGIKAEQIFFKNSSGDSLCAWYFKNPGTDKIIVFNHGNAGNMSHRLSFAETFTNCGASLFFYDYRGFGRSSGQETVKGIVNDGLSAYDYVRKQLGYRPDNIIVAGESIGSLVACSVASNRACDRVFLQAPLKSIAAVGKVHFPIFRYYPDFLFPGAEFVNTEAIKQIHVPVLLIHGQKDTTVPFENSEKIIAVANHPKSLLPLAHCGHNDIGYYDAELYESTLRSFIQGKTK